MIICSRESRQYASDISCEKVGGHFIIETSGNLTLNIQDAEGNDREITLLMSQEKFDCDSIQEALSIVNSLRQTGYKTPDWINDCLELTESISETLNS